MIVPHEVRLKWGCSDVDVALFLDFFDEPANSRILLVGCHDERTPEMLVECGFDVTGVDLREYDGPEPKRSWRHIRADFCNMDRFDFSEGCNSIEQPVYEPFDCVVAISAIEHFGLGTYQEGKMHRYYDVIAMHRIWELLKIGGKAYVTVPVAGQFLEILPHWRVYSMEAMRDRIVQDFELLTIACGVSGPCVIDGMEKDVGDNVTPEEIERFDGEPPHLSAIAIMRKAEVKRLAPDGR